ncbi:MAG: hypothetical protein QM729_02740 [Solirubrobacterales bacterium]
MEASATDSAPERDTAADWRIQRANAPATVVELEGRIDVALATARSAEEAALEIGAASLEAAEQARRAAALAERASAAAMRAAGEVAAAPRVVEVPRPGPQPAAPMAPRRPDPFDERLTAFRERAESVMIRLQKLEAGAVPGEGPSEVVRLR